MALFVETHVRSQDRQKGAQQFVDKRGMFVQPFYFVSYYVYWIEYDDYFFYF